MRRLVFIDESSDNRKFRPDDEALGSNPSWTMDWFAFEMRAAGNRDRHLTFLFIFGHIYPSGFVLLDLAHGQRYFSPVENARPEDRYANRSVYANQSPHPSNRLGLC